MQEYVSSRCATIKAMLKNKAPASAAGAGQLSLLAEII